MSKPAYLQMAGARDAGWQDSQDFHETPAIATNALLGQWKPDHYVWEPACGHGAISEVLTAAGHSVISTDLHNHGYGFAPLDFMQAKTAMGECIVTNPPFNISTAFVRHACGLVQRSAFLLRLPWLEGIERYRTIFSKGWLEQVLVFSKRLPRMHRVGWEGPKATSTIAFAWFTFNTDYHGKAQVDWL